MLLDLLDILVISVWLLLQLALLRWSCRERPTDLVGAKYPRTILFTMGLPFLRARQSIDPSDLVTLKRCRHGLRLRYIFGCVIPGYLVILYFYNFYIKYIYLDTTLEEILEM